jgi:hypothetical protein
MMSGSHARWLSRAIAHGSVVIGRWYKSYDVAVSLTMLQHASSQSERMRQGVTRRAKVSTRRSVQKSAPPMRQRPRSASEGATLVPKSNVWRRHWRGVAFRPGSPGGSLVSE